MEEPTSKPWTEDMNLTVNLADVVKLREDLARKDAALREIFETPAGLEGKTMQQMAMEGVSPVKLIGKMRDIAGRALAPKEEE